MAGVFTVLLVPLFVTEGTVGSSVTSFSLQSCKIGMKMTNRWFDSYRNVRHFTDCARECIFLKKCKSWNYNKVRKSCYLNYINSTEVSDELFVEEGESIYCDREDLPQVFAGTCSSAPCALFEKCLPLKPHQCVAYCGEPYLDNAERYFRYTQCHTVSCGNTFACSGTLVQSKEAKMHSTCQANGRWTTVVTKCVNMTSCQEVRDCNPTYHDGEYWLVWEPGPGNWNLKWVKIYCANMQEGATPREYLSLPVPSTTEYSGFKGYFSKIRINMTTLKLDIADFLASDRSDCMPQYGVIASDPNLCPSSVYAMTFDMSRTGFKIQPLPVWEMTNDPQPITEYKPNTGNKIVQVYGTIQNSYSRVEPISGIYLALDETEEIPKNAATRAECV